MVKGLSHTNGEDRCGPQHTPFLPTGGGGGGGGIISGMDLLSIPTMITPCTVPFHCPSNTFLKGHLGLIPKQLPGLIDIGTCPGYITCG